MRWPAGRSFEVPQNYFSGLPRHLVRSESAMRLSFGQELRMVQKQVLAPRMIQSMEILQLPIMALQERIEQEMQENPILELQEEDPDLPAEEVEHESTRRSHRRRTRAGHRRDARQRGRFRAAAEDGRGVARPLRGAQPRPRATRMEEEGDRKHDAMANMVARPQSLQDYLHDQLGWFDLEPRSAAMCDRIIYNLDPTATCRAAWKTCSGPRPTEEDLALAQQALAVVQKLDPPGVAARDLRECLLLQLDARACPATNNSRR